jgi:hypothetical protein
MLGWNCSREHLKRRSIARPAPGLEFHIGEPLDRCRHAEVLGGGLSDRGFDLTAHRIQIQLAQFLFERSHRSPFRIRE